MAVCEARETFRERGEDIDEAFTYTLTRTWDVWTNSLLTTAGEAYLAQDTNTGEFIPNVGDIHPDRDGFTCVKVRARQDTENPYRWFVDVEYSTLWDPGSGNPLLVPPEIRWDGVVIRKAVDEALYINAAGVISPEFGAVVNSAWDPYEPPPEQNDGYHRVTITINLNRFPREIPEKHEFTINSVPWYDFKRATVLMNPMSGNWFKRARIWYFRATYTLEIKRATWDLFLLNRGYRQLVPDAAYGAHREEIRDRSAGHGPSSPYLLAENGSRLEPEGDPIYHRWRVYDETDFNALNLPNPTAPPEPPFAPQ